MVIVIILFGGGMGVKRRHSAIENFLNKELATGDDFREIEKAS
jgi:hypothetical protein